MWGGGRQKTHNGHNGISTYSHYPFFFKKDTECNVMLKICIYMQKGTNFLTVLFFLELIISQVGGGGMQSPAYKIHCCQNYFIASTIIDLYTDCAIFLNV